MTARKQSPETRIESSTRLALPELTAESFDDQFPIRPSVVDGWIDVINSRHASVMELAAFTSPYIRAYAESVAVTLAVASPDKNVAQANKKIISAGVLYGACLDNEPESQADLHIEPMRAANYIGMVAQDYGRYANTGQALFTHARRLEIEHTGSDVIATTFNAVQDHIGTIFSSETTSRDDAQVLFYLSAVAGALAAQPADQKLPTKAIKLRDDLIGNDGVPLALSHWNVQSGHGLRASETVERALAHQFNFASDFSAGTITVANGRLIQVLPDTCIGYGPEDSFVIPFNEVAKLVIEFPRLEDRYPGDLGSHVTLVQDFENLEMFAYGRVVGLKTRRDGLVFNAYDSVHPYKRTVGKALAGSGLNRRPNEIYPEDLSRLDAKTDALGRAVLERYINST